MRSNVLAVAVTAVLLSACAIPKKNYVPASIQVSEPAIGQVATAEVGATMVRQGRYSEGDALYLEQSVKFGVLGGYVAQPGYYLKEGEDAKAEFYNAEPGPEGGRVEQSALADPFSALQLYKSENKLCGVSVLGGKACESNAPVRRVRRPRLTADGFQQSLIYSGKVGSKINVGYREFSSSVARPAFNNDVEYDLSESTTIGYKGAEIEVIEATNRHIKYRVIRNFNDAAR